MSDPKLTHLQEGESTMAMTPVKAERAVKPADKEFQRGLKTMDMTPVKPPTDTASAQKPASQDQNTGQSSGKKK